MAYNDYVDPRQEFTLWDFTDPNTGMGGYNPLGLVLIGDDGYGYSFYVEPNVIGVKITHEQFRDLCLKCSYDASGRTAFDEKVSIVIENKKVGINQAEQFWYYLSRDYYKLNGQALAVALKSCGIRVYFHDNTD